MRIAIPGTMDECHVYVEKKIAGTVTCHFLLIERPLREEGLEVPPRRHFAAIDEEVCQLRYRKYDVCYEASQYLP
jgi:hypothetical protein